MSLYITLETGSHLNKRTEIIQEMRAQQAGESVKSHQNTGSQSGSRHSKVSVLLDRFIEICPV